MSEQKVVSIERKTVAEGSCNACDVDGDIHDMFMHDVERYAKARATRIRYHIRIGDHITRLCPDCMTILRAEITEALKPTRG